MISSFTSAGNVFGAGWVVVTSFGTDHMSFEILKQLQEKGNHEGKQKLGKTKHVL